MKSKAKIVFFIIILLIIQKTLFSQNAPKYSNEFLSIGVGARSLSMGGAVVSSTVGLPSVYWNPAALSLCDKQIEIGAMHSEYFAGISKYDFLGVSYRIDSKSAAALSVIRFGVDDIPNTLDLIDADGNIRYDRITSFSVADYAFLLTYSRKLPINGLSIGGNVKIIRRGAGDFAHAWGFGLDAALHYNFKHWFFGAAFRDVTGTFNAWKFNQDALHDAFVATGNEIPQNGVEITLPRIMLATGYLFRIGKKFTIYPEVDLVVTTDGKRNVPIKSKIFSIDPAAGLEVGYNNIVFLRCGFCNFQQLTDFDQSKYVSWQPNIGVGINFYGFRLDYAFTDIGDQSIALYSHVFSLSFRFNTKNFATSSARL